MFGNIKKFELQFFGEMNYNSRNNSAKNATKNEGKLTKYKYKSVVEIKDNFSLTYYLFIFFH